MQNKLLKTNLDIMMIVIFNVKHPEKVLNGEKQNKYG
jgi:hypothetical protein